MPVLVTGASGFVGLNLVEALLGRGAEVVAYDAQAVPESAHRAFASLPGALEEVVGDVRDDAALNRLFEEFSIDRAWHGAAVTGAYDRERKDGRSILDVNTMGTHAVLEAARRRGVRRFVFASSTSVYGESLYQHAEVNEETTPPLPDAIYGISQIRQRKIEPALPDDVEHGRCLRAHRRRLWAMGAGHRLPRSLVDILPVGVPRGRGKGSGSTARGLASRPGLRPQRRRGSRRPSFRRGADVRSLQTWRPGAAVGTGPWCERLKARYPAFTYRVAGAGEEANVDHHETRNRGAQSMRRMVEDIGFQPKFSLDEALDDYCDWIDRTPGFRNP